jgi:hypothetical protein
MKLLLRVLVVLAGVLFVVLGLRWAVDPSGAAAELGMTLMDGVGRSSQIADVGALFLSMGIMVLIGVITAQRSWFYAPALMLALAAVFRILAWLVHDAALVIDMILVEVVVSSLLLFTASRLSRES